VSNCVTGKIEFSREDIDWRVEQKLARVLAERDRYDEGFWHGIYFVLFFVLVGWLLSPEIKEFLKAK